MSIDAEKESPLERLKKYKGSAGAPFAKLKVPAGEQQFGYRIKFLKDATIRMNTRFPKADGSPKPELIGTVEFTAVYVEDPDIKKGDVRRLNLSRHTSCERYFKEVLPLNQDGSYAANGKEFDIMIQGKVKTKNVPQGFWQYAIFPAANLEAGVLLEALFDDVPLFADE
jgi:hypothetical protein